jgi:hypothetical protein
MIYHYIPEGFLVRQPCCLVLILFGVLPTSFVKDISSESIFFTQE